jgi:hypothetical protein
VILCKFLHIASIGTLPPRDRAPSDITDAAIEFILQAVEDLTNSNTKPKNRRERHLLALPLIATGFAGMRNKAGKILDSLLPELERLASTTGADICLVVWEQVSFVLRVK